MRATTLLRLSLIIISISALACRGPATLQSAADGGPSDPSPIPSAPPPDLSTQAPDVASSPDDMSVPADLASPSGHSVVLSWTASATPGVTYKLFRATSSGGPYTSVSSGLAAPGYTDTSVASGVTYYYVAVAVSAANVESGYSNQATAVVP
jgi:hypothetical protein